MDPPMDGVAPLESLSQGRGAKGRRGREVLFSMKAKIFRLALTLAALAALAAVVGAGEKW